MSAVIGKWIIFFLRKELVLWLQGCPSIFQVSSDGMRCPRISGQLLCASSLSLADPSSLSLDWKWTLFSNHSSFCSRGSYYCLFSLPFFFFSSPWSSCVSAAQCNYSKWEFHPFGAIELLLELSKISDWIWFVYSAQYFIYSNLPHRSFRPT